MAVPGMVNAQVLNWSDWPIENTDFRGHNEHDSDSIITFLYFH